MLAPHYSSLSIGRYRGAARRGASPAAPSSASSSAGGPIPASSTLLAERRRCGTSTAHVVFTAHSLPARILDEGDPYRDELLETARLVAERAGVHEWTFSFQSESPTGEPWLGPDILEHLNELAATDVRDVVVCPIGFVADHLEIRWDLDVEAAEQRARSSGSCSTRIELPNDEPAFIQRARRARPAGARLYRPSRAVKTGQIRRRTVSRRFRVRTTRRAA